MTQCLSFEKTFVCTRCRVVIFFAMYFISQEKMELNALCWHCTTSTNAYQQWAITTNSRFTSHRMQKKTHKNIWWFENADVHWTKWKIERKWRICELNVNACENPFKINRDCVRARKKERGYNEKTARSSKTTMKTSSADWLLLHDISTSLSINLAGRSEAARIFKSIRKYGVRCFHHRRLIENYSIQCLNEPLIASTEWIWLQKNIVRYLIGRIDNI